MMLKTIAVFVLVLLAVQTQCGTAWADFETGKITPVTSFSGNISYSSYYYSIPHSNPGPSLLACLALISYDAVLSTTFTFNSTIDSINSTSAYIMIQTYSTTYFRSLSYHYLITTHPTIQIKNLCYYTTDLFTGSGARSQYFSNATTTFNGAYLTLVTVITGMKISNTQGEYFHLQVESFADSLPLVRTRIRTEEYNLVEWTCLAVIVYNPKTTLVGEFYFRATSQVSNSLGLSLVTAIDPAYQIYNSMFFGLSLLQMSMTLTDSQIFFMDSGSLTPLSSPNINQNQLLLYLQQLFLWQDTCISTSSNAVPTSGFNCSLGCALGQYKNANKYCMACSVPNGYCRQCDSTQCTSCDSASPTYRTLNTSPAVDVCVCMSGFYDVSGTCYNCTDSIANCIGCTNTTFCTSCTVNYTANANGICVCNAGTYLSGGECGPLMGCLVYDLITSGYFCYTCDTSNYFEYLINATCQCQAHTTYDSVTGTCKGICSDGVSLANQCDLGANNGVSGSGCAANCTVVNGYYCSSSSTAGPSICVLKTNYSGTYLYATRDLTSNTAQIYVQLSPADAVLSQMDFSSLITTSIPTSSLTTTYDAATGLLIIYATYSQSIEGTSQMLNISFNSTQIYSPSVVLYPTTEGENARLQFGTFQTYNNIINYLAMFVGGFGLAIAIVSGIVGYKLIGFEICLPIQVVYFTMLMLNVPQASISSLYTLSFSSGYNRLSSFNILDQLSLDKGLIVLQRTPYFLQNCNYSYIPLLVLLIISAVTRLWVPPPPEDVPKKIKEKKQQQKEELIPKEDEPVAVIEKSGCEKAHLFIVDRLLVNFWVLLLLNAIFAFGLQLQVQSNTGKFSANANVGVSIAVGALMLGGLAFIGLKVKQKEKTITFRSYSRHYPMFYIGTQVAAIIIIVCTYYATNLAVLGLFLPQILVIVWLCKFNPHGKFKSFINITGLYCQLLPPIATGLFVLNNYMNSTLIGTISAFLVLTLALVGEGLSIARLVLKYREDASKIKESAVSDKVKVQVQNLEALTYNSIKNQLMNNSKQKMNWQPKSLQEDSKASPSKIAQYQKLQSQVDSEDQEQKKDDEEDQLRKLKMRLRKEIFQNRNQDL